MVVRWCMCWKNWLQVRIPLWNIRFFPSFRTFVKLLSYSWFPLCRIIETSLACCPDWIFLYGKQLLHTKKYHLYVRMKSMKWTRHGWGQVPQDFFNTDHHKRKCGAEKPTKLRLKWFVGSMTVGRGCNLYLDKIQRAVPHSFCTIQKGI